MNRFSLDELTWSEFYLIDFFDMFAGKYYPKNSYREGRTPLITAKSVDNGINQFTNLESRFSGGCLTIGKVGMDIFYQYSPFVASSDVTVLVPKFKAYDEYVGKFIAVSARQQAAVFGYGNQIRLNDSMKIRVMLPVTKDRQPDWKFMKNYMHAIKTNLLLNTTRRFKVLSSIK